jgi:sialidase-1
VTKLLTPKLGTVKDGQKRCGISRELVRAGDPGKAKVMLDLLAGEDDYAHVHAAESLYKVNEIGDGVAMKAAMKRGENPKLTLMAAAAIARKTGDAEEIARIAAWVLSRIGDKSDIPALRKRLDIVDPMPHAYIVHALAMLGDEEGLAGLAKNLTSDDPAIRTYAATFAGEARAFGTKDRLIEMLDDENIDARARAAQSLIVLSQPAP